MGEGYKHWVNNGNADNAELPNDEVKVTEAIREKLKMLMKDAETELKETVQEWFNNSWGPGWKANVHKNGSGLEELVKDFGKWAESGDGKYKLNRGTEGRIKDLIPGLVVAYKERKRYETMSAFYDRSWS